MQCSILCAVVWDKSWIWWNPRAIRRQRWCYSSIWGLLQLNLAAQYSVSTLMFSLNSFVIYECQKTPPPPQNRRKRKKNETDNRLSGICIIICCVLLFFLLFNKVNYVFIIFDCKDKFILMHVIGDKTASSFCISLYVYDL